MRKKLFIICLIIQTLFLTISCEKSNQLADKRLPKLGKIKNFSLTSSNNEKITTDSIKNKVIVSHLFFSRCPKVCPTLIKDLQKILDEALRTRDKKSLNNFKILSVTIDPEFDTVPVLSKHKKKLQINNKSWILLTGTNKATKNFADNVLLLGSPENPNGHSARFVLIDKQGEIRGFYDSKSNEAKKKLITDFASLL